MAETALPRPAPMADIATSTEGPGLIAAISEGRGGLRRYAEIRARHKAEQEAEREAERARAALIRTLRKEARFYWPKIRDALQRLGMYHKVNKENEPGLVAMLLTSKRSTQVVRKKRTAFEPNYIAFEIDTDNLPWMTSIPDIFEEKVELDLSYVCNRVVKVLRDETFRGGIWIHVFRDESIAGIPRHLDYLEAYEKFPEKAHPTEFIIGQGPGQLVYHDNLQSCQHILVAGTPGSGKSNWLNTTLITMCRRNSPVERG